MIRSIPIATILLVLGCGGSAPPPAPPTPAPAAPAAPPAPAVEAKKQPTEDELKLQKDFETLEAEKAAEVERFTEELQKKVKALVDMPYASTTDAVKAAMKGPHRMGENAKRDPFRHPAETLEFFGLRQGQTVVEIGPGAGWYTEILAPVLAKKGKLYVTMGDADGPKTERGTFYALRTKYFLEKSKEAYGNVEPIKVVGKDVDLGIDGKADLVLWIRGLHGAVDRGQHEAWLGAIHESLKPGGTLGIVAHRGTKDSDPKETAKKGYLPEPWVIEQVKAAGFELAGKSEINANPKDTKDHPEGVWALPPSLRLGDKDRDKYVAIGESDRMTLKFKKVAKPAAK